MKNELVTRRIIELGTLLLIGDGFIGLIKPRWHSLLWDFGPKLVRAATEELAEHPRTARAIYAAEVALGIVIASRQTPDVRMNKTVAQQNGNAFHGDAAALAEELRGKIRGEVRFDPGSRALYAADGSNYREVPIGVVIPRDDDVISTVAICRKRGAPILSRGCGTSLAGQCCNVAVV